MLELEIKKLKKENKKYKKALNDLNIRVMLLIEMIDFIMNMKNISPFERGQKMAKLTNWIDFYNDHIFYITLGNDIHKNKKQRSLEKFDKNLFWQQIEHEHEERSKLLKSIGH